MNTKIRNKRGISIISGLVVGAVIGLYLVTAAVPSVSTAYAEETPEVSPVKARERDTYYPNSEDLAPDEMRVIACGTGMPTTRAAQAAACFLVELGNGDKFLFDIGSGSAERISSLQIPYTISTRYSSATCTPTTSGRCMIFLSVAR